MKKAVVSQRLLKCPNISQTTVERTLKGLLDSGKIAKVGSGRATGYQRPQRSDPSSAPSAAGAAVQTSSRYLPFRLPPSLDDVILPVPEANPRITRSARSCQKRVSITHKPYMIVPKTG